MASSLVRRGVWIEQLRIEPFAEAHAEQVYRLAGMSPAGSVPMQAHEDAAMVALAREAVRSASSPASPRSRCMVAMAGQRVVGFVAVRREPSAMPAGQGPDAPRVTARIGWLRVHPSAMGTIVPVLLAERALSCCRSWGVDAVHCEPEVQAVLVAALLDEACSMGQTPQSHAGGVADGR
ncbi:MAG: hypothetical protein KatS3mg103_0084 [Phycisphaerales bacterium]|nr:MAG: hypothetical protein KatS3mg103_0084 [Phycisphaerales bacterium]